MGMLALHQVGLEVDRLEYCNMPVGRTGPLQHAYRDSKPLRRLDGPRGIDSIGHPLDPFSIRCRSIGLACCQIVSYSSLTRCAIQCVSRQPPIWRFPAAIVVDRPPGAKDRACNGVDGLLWARE